MSGTGPITLFDKSTLQSLTVDEAVWFDTFYFPSMTPLFFVETLADLEKEMAAGKNAESLVGALADKTPLGGGVNVHHNRLSTAELVGNKIEMKRLPVIEGGDSVFTRDGRRAVIFDQQPESVALSRWREKKFLDVERQFAKQWRDTLSAIDMEAIFQQGRDIIRRVGRPKDLAAAKNVAAQLLQNRSSRYVLDALVALKPKQVSSTVVDRWKSYGTPSITTYAPFTAHILLVD